MATYKSPGVYIEEIQVFPPSVAQVETAIPTFIGYTEKTEYNGQNIKDKPIKIKSLLEYEEIFGGGFPDEDEKYITVTFNSDSSVNTVAFKPKFYLYDSIRLFYANGGGFCYVVAVNSYRNSSGNPNTIVKDELNNGIETIKKEDEPTLIVVPDSVLLDQDSLTSSVHTKALDQCAELGDRFAILDIRQGDKKIDLNLDPVANFRNAGSANNLKYGAAYYPWVHTTLSFDFKFKNIVFKDDANNEVDLADILGVQAQSAAIVNQLQNVIKDVSKIKKYIQDGTNKGNNKNFQKEFNDITGSDFSALESKGMYIINAIEKFRKWNTTVSTAESEFSPFADADSTDVIQEPTIAEIHEDSIKPESAIDELLKRLDEKQGTEGQYGTDNQLELDFDHTGYSATTDPEDLPTSSIEEAISEFNNVFKDLLNYILLFLGKAQNRAKNLELLLEQQTPLYSGIVKRIKEQGIILPPSGAIAGIYAKVDSNRGVWKAPANISLNEVSGPTVKIDNAEQDSLNIDVNSGKSVNAIRSFTGKGTMVWGARTLAGNDNEWKYISVRRFFNMVEESVKKATAWAVFEPNDANTWIRVKSMIENYLTLLWRQGALAGSTTEKAFFVKVGLGITMTAQDILEGRMNVEIGMAAVRPAEFIILKFSHKMQEA